MKRDEPPTTPPTMGPVLLPPPLLLLVLTVAVDPAGRTDVDVDMMVWTTPLLVTLHTRTRISISGTYPRGGGKTHVTVTSDALVLGAVSTLLLLSAGGVELGVGEGGTLLDGGTDEGGMLVGVLDGGGGGGSELGGGGGG